MDFSKYGTPSPEWQAFVESHPEAGKPGKVNHALTPEQIQKQTNASREVASAALFEARNLSAEVGFTDHLCPTRDGSSISVRRYHPKQASASRLSALVYFHGGGYLFGSLDSEILFCGTICSELGIAVLHVCYRHAPKFAHPTAHNDGQDGMEWIVNHADVLGIDLERVVIGGLSAGAAVAANVALSISSNSGSLGTIRARGLVLGIPWLVHQGAFPFDQFANREVASQEQCADAPVISKENIDFFMDLLQVDDPTDPLLNVPLRPESELRRFPKTAIVVSGRDPLRDGGLLLAERLKQLE